MKTHAKLFLMVALASGFALANPIKADVARTPKGESLRPSSVTVDTKGEPDLVRDHPITGNARAAQLRHSAMAGGAANEQIASERPVYTGRNPFRELRNFEIAPFANQGKECAADCQKPCCTKK